MPVRREVGAVLSLFLALFVGISYFMNEGAFILFFLKSHKGIDRLGLLAHSTGVPARRNNSRLPPRRPVALRVFCALMIPILAASVMSLMMYKYQLDGGDIKLMCSLLFEQGQRLDSAGCVRRAHCLCAFEKSFSIYGALPVLLVCLVFAIIVSVNGSFKKVADKVKLQVEAKYDPSMYERMRSSP